MASSPCYLGPNPIKEEERFAVWKWAKENAGVDAGVPIGQVGQSINDFFYGGQAKPEWINDILSGRKTPFREVATEMWKKQYNRRVITQQAKEISQIANMGPVGKWLRRLWTAPRTVAVFGHGVVFPVTHGGDLVFRPASWGTFIKGTIRTYHGAFSKAFSERMLTMMEGDSMYDLGLHSGVDMGRGSHPSGLISRSYHGPAQRAWDMLTVMRFQLWKRQMGKFVKPSMSSVEVLDVGKNLADWANKATGSSRGPIADIGGEALFGPKLTQSKLSRITVDPVKTIKTFADWKNATAGEKAVAWTRLSGSTQFLVTNLGFLAVNAGVLYAIGSKDKINFSDPMKGDFMGFKGGGIEGFVPGLHTEIRTLAKLLSIAFTDTKIPGKKKPLVQNPELKGESKFSLAAKTVGQYGMAKLTPTIQRGLEVGFGQDWQGRPLPWSKDKGTPTKPRLTYGEYAGDIGPIPLSGPIGYVYDQIRNTGATELHATQIIKALIITGLGLPGLHAREEKPQTEKPKKQKGAGIRQE